MGDILVSRHSGLIDWARTRLGPHRRVETLDPASVQPSDRIHGVLPIDIAAEVCARGACFYAVVYDRGMIARGADPTAGELEAAGARFERFHVERVLG